MCVETVSARFKILISGNLASLVKSDIIKERDGFEESYTVRGSGFDDMVASKVGSK